MNNLKFCPFCNGVASLEESKLPWVTEKGGDVALSLYTVCCDDCEASISNYYQKQHAIDAWNKRVN